jgi:hypothetical protein
MGLELDELKIDGAFRGDCSYFHQVKTLKLKKFCYQGREAPTLSLLKLFPDNLEQLSIGLFTARCEELFEERRVVIRERLAPGGKLIFHNGNQKYVRSLFDERPRDKENKEAQKERDARELAFWKSFPDATWKKERHEL